MSADATDPPIRNIIAPWKVSMSYAAMGVFLTLLIYKIPSWRWLPLPEGQSFPTQALVLVIPLIAVVWAVVGIVLRKAYKGILLCLVSIAIAAVSMAVIANTFWTDEFRDEYLRKAIPSVAARVSNR